MRAPLIILIWLVCVAADPALAQEPAASMERVRSVLPVDAAERIGSAVERASAEGLPTQPLLHKALEGAAKGVPAPRIVAAVEELHGQLGAARRLLDGAPITPVDVVAVADALRRGVPGEAVRDLRLDAGPDEPVAMAVHTLADLLDRGVPVDVALDVLGAWRGRGANPAQLDQLPAAVERLVRGGMDPVRAGREVAGAVRRGGPPENPPGASRGRGQDGEHPGQGRGRENRPGDRDRPGGR